MTDVIFELSADLRSDKGKGASRRLRRKAGLVPAIIYGAGKEPTSISIPHNKVIRALEDEAFYSHILTLNIGDKKEKVVLKDIQRHPFKKQILHMDFLRIKADEKIHMQVPIHFIGEDVAPGVKTSGGIISHQMTDVEIVCLPANLPEFLEADLSNLELNESLHLTDIKLPEGVEIVALIQGDEHDQSIANIHKPRAAKLEEPETEKAESTEGAEGEAKTEDAKDVEGTEKSEKKK
jgi:large subunit ribosomal protein L25